MITENFYQLSPKFDRYDYKLNQESILAMSFAKNGSLVNSGMRGHTEHSQL